MTNGGNRGGYLKLFLASHEDAVVQIRAEAVNINEVLVIPGERLVQGTTQTEVK